MSIFKTIFFDLDGTLLPMQMDRFLKAYLGRLSARFAPQFDPERFIKVLLDATDAMVRNTDAAKTNETVFRESFFVEIGADPDQMMPALEHFYESEFPHLCAYTEPTPLARQVVAAAAARGCDLVLATNPIFPQMAIRERMRWAGIEDLPFTLVTDYESMHYCKPHVQYYAEILQRVGAAPHDCLMVGNDLAEDMVAAELGVGTYLVEDNMIAHGGNPAHVHHRGTLGDLLGFLERNNHENTT